MNANRALWEKGDFTRIAAGMRESGDEFVASLGVKPGFRVLDLACGDGTTALPAARLGADVLGVDIASNLVAAGQKRASEAGLANCRFQEGDACSLDGVPDRSFDLVVSMFGAMFAPQPGQVAKEMVRVCRPGGRVVMGNWIPNDPTLVAQILKTCAGYMPPPPQGFVSPMMWGVEANVVERFGGAGIAPAKVDCRRDTYTFRFPGSVSSAVAAFKNYYGPTMNAFEAAAKDGRAEQMQQDLEQLFASHNESPNAEVTVVPATFLRVTVSV